MKGKSIALVAVSVLMSGAVLAQTAAGSSSATRLQAGKKTYDYWCATCHGADRGLPGFEELPGTQQLRIKYRGTKTPAGRYGTPEEIAATPGPAPDLTDDDPWRAGVLPEPRALRPLPVGAVLKRLGPSGLELRGEDLSVVLQRAYASFAESADT